MCEAGLHISLGVGLRLFNLLGRECVLLDVDLVMLEAAEGSASDDNAIRDLVHRSRGSG